jgi:hypothetical protein
VNGIALHLSRTSATGYARVSHVPTRRLTPYRVKAPNGKLLGYFASPVDAALCYANHVAAATELRQLTLSGALDLADTAVAPSGEIVRLHLSPRTSTGYRGVHLLSGKRAKPYAARLGPSAADQVGHFTTAIEAATAVACALQARDKFIDELRTNPQGCATLHALPSHEPNLFADFDVDALLADLPASGVT